MTLAELKAAIEAEALRRQAARDDFSLDAVRSYFGQGASIPESVRPLAPPPPDPLTYAYFAALHGREFVTTCYTALLGRGPDPGGLEHYTQLLMKGEDKAMVLGRIAFSPEARKRGAHVAGLLPRVAIATLEKVPVAGWILAWVIAVVALPVRQRERHAFEQQVHARLDAMADYVAQSGAQVAMRVDTLRSVLQYRD